MNQNAPPQTLVNGTSIVSLRCSIGNRTARVGVVGLGYVGLPVAVSSANSGFETIGFDVDSQKLERLSCGKSYIEDVDHDTISAIVNSGRFTASCDFERLSTCDVVLLCVPTPIMSNCEPDLSFVTRACMTLVQHLSSGTLIVLESTTYPGTTAKLVAPILETSGHRIGRDIFLGYSPERQDPGNGAHQFRSIPKVVSGLCGDTVDLVGEFYESIVNETVRVSSTEVAEAVKLTENVFRSVNIALVNELKLIFDKMKIDIWEVIDGAKTKPFGFVPFYPGPGVGGHCIPVDPHYLTWKAREFGALTRIIDAASEVNANMPSYVVGRLRALLDCRLGKALNQSRVLVAGIAYKKNVSETQGSPGVSILLRLEAEGASVDYVDPHVPRLAYDSAAGTTRLRRSWDGESAGIPAFDAVVVVTDHDALDYPRLLTLGHLLIDTRNAMSRRQLLAEHVMKV